MTMGFRVFFRPGTPTAGQREEATALVVEDDPFAVTIAACGVLAAAAGSEFCIEGFGRKQWSVDVAYDLSTFLEATPDLMASVREGQVGEVDLYGQGVECRLSFGGGDPVEVRCVSQSGWQPAPEHEVEHVAREELIRMLTDLARETAQALAVVAPSLAWREPFRAWNEGIV
ncbi:hypothetical protein ACFVDI_16160 [Nocardioides sp. NPDC057767]|uniref:hypothetical protein n=1 Tax=unclassified Nocardioides TaxID=2615069 RepID=UPI003670C12A